MDVKKAADGFASTHSLDPLESTDKVAWEHLIIS